ncbi:MAG: phosphoribosylformylglycinamidine synthase [Erysipelotrichaceae bacterium]
MVNKRIFVEKKLGFRVEADSLKAEFNQNLKLQIKSLHLFNVYDIFNISENLYHQSLKTVFGEVVTDLISEELDLVDKKYLAIEYLPGTFDQRATSAQECLALLDPSSETMVKSAKLLLIEGVSDLELELIKNYYLNNIESRIKDLNEFSKSEYVKQSKVQIYHDFIKLNSNQLENFWQNKAFAMSLADLKYIQEYFIAEQRNPNEVELALLDTYWSDHCRHTTFETILENIKFESSTFIEEIQKSYEYYLRLRQVLKRADKPETLMDIATIYGKYLRFNGQLEDLELSDEINACSVYIDVDVDGKLEKWLLMFKNETHNHPTEIEPFGGASTCIGGAIRDPLSGRSYVYQAMRISGCANVLESFEDTLANKLPQSSISTGATCGYSSYGNQIGLATSYVRELYHQGYRAKHMEVGAVVGAIPADYIRREKPVAGDVVIMLGGKTGRDGIGGATGSSKQHNDQTLTIATSEVQKGNAPEERKIQRLFRNKKVTRLIKKSNDFGAGGVSVAIGEIADSLDIYLDNIETKYSGLNALELAISESQERMAVVVEAGDVESFIEYARAENLKAYKIADVKDHQRLRMYYQNELVVDIAREFIETSGIRQSSDVIVKADNLNNPFVSKKYDNLHQTLLDNLKDLNICSQKALVENFDNSVGAGSVLLAYGGKYQRTPAQVSVAKLPVLNGDTNTTSLLAYGYNPFISEYSPYLGSQYAVVESLSKIVATGASYQKVRFSFQEYFEKLANDPQKWGKAFSSLLGALKIQSDFELPAIGGKDSMSGSYLDYHVPPTLIAFGVTTENIKNIISPEFKDVNNHLYLIKHQPLDKHLINSAELMKNFDFIYQNIKSGKIVSAMALEFGGLSEALVKMAIGNEIGFSVKTDLDLFAYDYGSIVIESKEELDWPSAFFLGKTSKSILLNETSFSFSELNAALESTLESVYPSLKENAVLPTDNYYQVEKLINKKIRKEVKVLLPVFPGTNSEYDMDRAFSRAGGIVKQYVFKNIDAEAIRLSCHELAELIDNSDIFAISGGFSAGDEPDGSGKFIVNILNNHLVRSAIDRLLARSGLILGICNGFQALIKSGLLPYGQIQEVNENSPTLFKNDCNRHIAKMAKTEIISNMSPWLNNFKCAQIHNVAISHGEGKFVINQREAKELFEQGMVAFKYSGTNPNGSDYDIEGITSKCGHILGKMAHSERYTAGIYKNIDGDKNQDIFKNAIDYLRGQ